MSIDKLRKIHGDFAAALASLAAMRKEVATKGSELIRLSSAWSKTVEKMSSARYDQISDAYDKEPEANEGLLSAMFDGGLDARLDKDPLYVRLRQLENGIRESDEAYISLSIDRDSELSELWDKEFWDEKIKEYLDQLKETGKELDDIAKLLK